MTGVQTCALPIFTFRPLEQADLEKIAALMLDEYKPGLEARGLKLEYTPAGTGSHRERNIHPFWCA